MVKSKWFVAALIGISAAVVHFWYVSRLEQQATGGVEVAVLTVAKAINAGEAIGEDDLATRMVPSSYIDGRTVLAERAKEIIDMVTNVDLKDGQLIQWTDFSMRDGADNRDLAELLEPGKRAMTIPVDRSLSMGGMLRPGHRVDILGTFSQGESRFNRVTVTVLQNIKVLATGDRIQSEPEMEADDKDSKEKSSSGQRARFNTVTLSVGLEEAEILSLSTKQGTLSLVLRGHQDLEVLNGVPEVSMKDIWESKRLETLKTTATIAPKPIERIQTR